MKGFVIAGTGSGSGKTTTCLGIMAWLSQLGYKVAPFKVGPDFIDPGHHTALTGKVSRNLDSWMLTQETNEKIFAKGCQGADIAVVEGVMGLFDGYSGTSEAGSTAQMAKWLGLPVILIVDARSMARSAAAIVQGFENFDPDLRFAGVIFSKTGSERHYDYLKSAVESTCQMPCIGHLPRNEKIIMPERHLGLVTSNEHRINPETVAELTGMIEAHTDLKKIIHGLPEVKPNMGSPEEEADPGAEATLTVKANGSQISDASPPLSTTDTPSTQTPDASPVRIAVARDSAFCFYYQENLEALEAWDAQIIPFSPISDASLPPDIQGIYFGGGYPELFAEALSSNQSMMAEVKQASNSGMPIYGECGGFMYLCRDITGMDGDIKWPMTGCFPFSAVMSKRMRSLGYRQIALESDTLIGKAGDILRGHEFHYSSLANDDDVCPRGDGNEKKRDSSSDNISQGTSGNTDSNEKENSSDRLASGDKELIHRIYQTKGRDGQEVTVKGYQKKQTLGSYLHAHFGSNPRAARSFTSACRNYQMSIITHGTRPATRNESVDNPSNTNRVPTKNEA